MKYELGFKLVNRYLIVTPARIELKIKCIQCGELQNYNVTKENIVEMVPCPCEGKRSEKAILEALPKLLEDAGFELKKENKLC
uniref:Uncharacterized protein n=1 Tax=viral metagenome TaxID=1070528 RepID=A0A6M3XLN1_9ZZZZ